jgi:hypothetical protein
VEHGRRLDDEPRLSRTCLASDQHHATGTGRRGRPRLVEHRELTPPSDKPGLDCPQPLRWQPLSGPRLHRRHGRRGPTRRR